MTFKCPRCEESVLGMFEYTNGASFVIYCDNCGKTLTQEDRHDQEETTN